MRPYLGNTLALYATSQVNAGTSALVARELNLVQFVDMPWLLQPDHPAVMIYPRAQFGDVIDFDRLYALGIDALRIGLELLRNTPATRRWMASPGEIRVTRNQMFVRELPAAQFVDGKTVVLGKPRR